MKIAFKYTSALLVSVGIALGSCQDFVNDLDVDPNNPALADAATMLQGIELADALLHEGEAARISAMWTAQFTGARDQYTSIGRYDVAASNFDNMWSNTYLEIVTQSRIAAAAALNERNPRLAGILQVLEAHAVGTTASLFGDIPFREVNDPVAFANPAYDPQQQVYEDLQQQLNAAISKLAGGGGSQRDIFYQGDGGRWTEAAYTLKARYFLHTQQYDSARRTALRGISNSGNDWLMPHKEVDGAENFYYQFNSERVGYLSATNSYAARLLDPSRQTTVSGNRNNAKTNESARFSYFFTRSPASNRENYGLLTNSGYAEPAVAFPILTYSENQLILAETYARAGDLSTALVHLNLHRNALAVQYGGRYDDYVLADIPGGATSTNMLKEILTERYLSFIGQIEPFNDARRTKNLINLPTFGTQGLPQRFLYPQSELNTNSISVPDPLPTLYSKTSINPL
ncbi:SusD/RagB family nutrient-binding outer membrane lipoprotein [uncultured Hymenobacter sp.]|uniref:SusD/RagB family nutrient-binding outer membrane lipoprotein n=1 Tax=uncultured Hymenobacter sp. TaxID=170016 RepID=UPI0035CC52E3